YGAVPPKGAPLRVPVYRTGGGPRGNVSARTVTDMRTPIPLVDRVENRRPALGGVAGETVGQAKERGPLLLRTRDRAVTAEDYELRFADLSPRETALERITETVDRCRPVGTRLLVEPPLYQGVTIIGRLIAKPRADGDRLAEEAVAALNGYFDPVRGGPDRE